MNAISESPNLWVKSTNRKGAKTSPFVVFSMNVWVASQFCLNIVTLKERTVLNVGNLCI